MNLQISSRYNLIEFLKKKFLEKMYLLDFSAEIWEE
jgi:hypothetical protein